MEIFLIVFSIYITVIVTHGITRATIKPDFRPITIKEIVRLPSEAIVFKNQVERTIYSNEPLERVYMKTVDQLLESIPKHMISMTIEPKVYGIPSDVFTAQIIILPPTKDNIRANW